MRINRDTTSRRHTATRPLARSVIRMGLLFLAALLIAPGIPAQPGPEAGPPLPAPAARAGQTPGPPRANRLGSAVFQADPQTGSLIVIADDETNAEIERIIQNLDRPVPQALIKVLFLEVTHSKGLDVGIDASYAWDSEDERELIETLFGVASETRGAFFTLLEDDLTATLRVLAEVGKLEVLSRPSILTRNNEPAVITVGQEIGRITNSRITQDGQTLNTIQYEDIGIILEVTPRITSDGLVEMDVAPEISTLTGDTVEITETARAPIIAKRAAQTRVVVPDGRTVVIGGLMEDQETESVQKIPILGDIPLLGMLFRRTIKSKSKTELLIFLTPHVIERTSQLSGMSAREAAKTDVAPEAFSQEELSKYIDSQSLAEIVGGSPDKAPAPEKKDQ